MDEAHRVGISPLTMRIAASFAIQGVGTYHPKGHSFDKVVVQVKMPWVADPTSIMKSMLVLEVSFSQNGRQQRAVEFALIPAGFSGDPIIKLVSP